MKHETSSILPTGPSVCVTHRLSLNKLDTRGLAQEMKDCGVTAVVPLRRAEAAEWSVDPEHHMPFVESGIAVYVGVDLDSCRDDDATVAAIVRALDAAAKLDATFRAKHRSALRASGVVLQWGDAWRGRRTFAERVVRAVVALRPHAPEWCTDLPPAAPLYTLDPETKARVWTDPSMPTSEFGALATGDRYARLHAPDERVWEEGELLRRYRWTRHASQYTELAKRARRTPWTMRPCLPTFGRSVQDVIDLLLQEPTQLLLTWEPLDDETRLGLRIVAKLNELGYRGEEAVQEFQNDRNLSPTGMIGEREVVWLQLTGAETPASPGR